MKTTASTLLVTRLAATLLAGGTLLCASLLVYAAEGPGPVAVAAPAAQPAKAAERVAVTPQTVEYSAPTEIAAPLRLTVGRSALVKMPSNVARLSVGNSDIADVVLINPREVYVLGKKVGSTNILAWARSGSTTIFDVVINMDTSALSDTLQKLAPKEKNIAVNSVAESVVLTGTVSDPMKAQRLAQLAEAYNPGKKVVNLMQVEGSQQVMLEVKVAEVSKTLLDKLGVEFNADRARGGWVYSLVTGFLTGSPGVAGIARGNDSLKLDAEMKKGLVKVLAEPTIMAVSGQEGAFLAGGKIFIPVPQAGIGGFAITLEEKEFGVGLRFIPTVLDDGRINLRVTPEVSELSQVGTPITTVNGQVNILPSITTRRASTTVQLRDGESFAIGGLIKNNVTEAVRAFPLLGELPVIGALFRSSEFQSDRSELLFIVTPRLVKPLGTDYALPTDSFVPPTRQEFFLEGRMEGQPQRKPLAPSAQPAVPPEFELK